MNIEEGQRVAFVKRGGSISLLPLNESLADHYGSIEVEGPQDFDALRAEARRREVQGRVATDVSTEPVESDAR
jgi:hypothetical protein